MTTDNLAHDQARAQYEHIAALVAAYELDYDQLESLQDELADLQSALEDARSYLETCRALLCHNDPETIRDLEEAEADYANADGALCDFLTEYKSELDEMRATAAAVDSAYPFTSQDDVAERIQETPLCVEVRSGWAEPGATISAEDFRVLLCTAARAYPTTN